jgi:hypothetical protein
MKLTNRDGRAELAGCLRRLDVRYLVHPRGVVSAPNILNFRMITPHGEGIAVYDFLRKSAQ